MREEILRSLLKIFLPLDGVTPKYVVRLIVFLWTHLPTWLLDYYVLALGVIALGGLDLFMSSEKAFNRVLIVCILLVISQFMIPRGWELLRNEFSFGLLVFVGMLYLLDYGLAVGDWNALEKSNRA